MKPLKLLTLLHNFMTPKELRPRIAEIHRLCQASSDQIAVSMPGVAWTDRPAEKALWDAIEKLHKDAGPGLVPGRHLRFQVADGYAHYIVTKVGKRLISVEHLDYLDGYCSEAVYDGKMMRGVAEKQLGWDEALRKIFSRKEVPA